MLKEFKNFIMTGNVIDLAVAVILAGAVGLVVSGFVSDIMMPIIGHFAGGVDFADMKVILSEAVVAADGTVAKPENAVMYGKWVNAIINLVIVGFVLFIIVKAYNKSKTPPAPVEKAPKGPTQEELLIEIRDALRK
ncbi:large conductance mechanosensitive channel protein MscL [Maribacter sp. ACAM166]|uniref:large conductance mechanosensitive channel protein MscL n=1 Tax=Maribacter sp. ACAM166 TaxID=2508996 RepID=UPI0010FE95F7|nr:large conductance mechanosensitive channel protein MscL [Maribacter sp. ACAM166]TLP73024.1 large conductance mechanosensitive channel protein MscL [Maribacter sp. ACAM166]